MQIQGGSIKAASGGINSKITVGLQSMYSYSVWLIIVLIIIALIPPIIWLILFIKKKHKNVVIEETTIIKSSNLGEIKQKYDNLICEIINKFNSGKLSDRHAYQQLSKVIRHFVFDVTGIKVQNYTLNEIKMTNIPMLYYLVDECYEPEFSEHNSGNIVETCEKARRVISEWN